MKHLYLLPIICLTFQVSVTNAQQADSAVSDSFYLSKEVVITAKRYEIDPINLPEATSVFNQGLFIENNPRSIPEAMIGMTGVWMQKTNHGGGSPFVRGLTGNQTLLLIDGIRLNNSTYRYGPNQYLNTVDPLSIQRIEVVRGSGSVQYGTDALGGAVQLLSKSPAFSTSGVQVGGNLYGKYMTDDGFEEAMELSGRAEVEISGEKVAILGGMSYKDFGDLVVGGDSLQSPSSYDEVDGDVKILFKASDSDVVTLAYQHVNQTDVTRYDQVAQRGRRFFFFDPQRRQLGYARWEHQGNNKWLSNIQATVSYQQSIEGRRQSRVGSTIIEHERDEVDTWGATVQIQSQPASYWTIVSGVEWYFDEVGSTAFDLDETNNSRTDVRGLYADGATASNLAIFTLHNVELENWIFTGGLRLNGVTIKAEDEIFGDLDVSPVALVGNVAAMYKIQPEQRIIVSFNTGFRTPNINDMSSFGFFDSGIEVPNDDLDPERSQTIEVGYKARWKNVRTELAVYNTSLSNLIVRRPATFQGSNTFEGEPVFQKTNQDKATIRGFEWELIGEMGDIELFTGLAYTWGEDDDGNPLRRIPPFNGRVGARYRHLDGLRAKAEWLFAARQDRLSGGDISDHRIPDGGTDGWNVINITTGYQFKGIYAGLGLQNLTDELYRLHGSGVDGYGRSLWLTLRVGM